MKKIKIIGFILFCLTLFSASLGVRLASLIGEAEILGSGGRVRYSWVILFFLPIAISSIIIGHKLKKSGQKYKKNYVAAIIMIPYLIWCGLECFTNGNNYSYDPSVVYRIEEKTKVDLPNNVNVSTKHIDYYYTNRYHLDYNLTYMKIIDEDEKKTFENEIKNNALWTTHLNSKFYDLLQDSILNEIKIFDYFVFYNAKTNEYNTYSTFNESQDCVLIAYNRKNKRIILMDGNILKINSSM